jgi:2''-5'' RNA ligase
MRLFIAINFEEEVKNQLCEAIGYLRENSLQGNFTGRENLHLTLVFIGETQRVEDIRHAMDAARAEPFALKIGGLGRFKRQGGDIYWMGVEQNPALTAIYDRLYDELKRSGFRLESRPYKPHLTLAREVVLRNSFDQSAFGKAFPPMTVQAEKISLMKSERIGGRLVYTEIYARRLEKAE